MGCFFLSKLPKWPPHVLPFPTCLLTLARGSSESWLDSEFLSTAHFPPCLASSISLIILVLKQIISSKNSVLLVDSFRKLKANRNLKCLPWRVNSIKKTIFYIYIDPFILNLLCINPLGFLLSCSWTTCFKLSLLCAVWGASYQNHHWCMNY